MSSGDPLYRAAEAELRKRRAVRAISTALHIEPPALFSKGSSEVDHLRCAEDFSSWLEAVQVAVDKEHVSHGNEQWKATSHRPGETPDR